MRGIPLTEHAYQGVLNEELGTEGIQYQVDPRSFREVFPKVASLYPLNSHNTTTPRVVVVFEDDRDAVEFKLRFGEIIESKPETPQYPQFSAMQHGLAQQSWANTQATLQASMANPAPLANQAYANVANQFNAQARNRF